MTKAERIYISTYVKCKNHVLANGKPERGFEGVSHRPGEKISRRTLNAVEKFLKEEEDSLKLHIKLGLGAKERNEQESWVFWMVRKTIENNRAALAS